MTEPHPIREAAEELAALREPEARDVSAVLQRHWPWPAKGEAHECEWRDLAELDGVHRQYLASYCALCGATMID